MDDLIAKTSAIVLGWEPIFTSSRRVIWFSRDFGPVTTIIRGSQRPKSFFLGQYDLFYTCELLFYRRGTAGARPTRECYPLKRRDHLRTDWRACAVASYLADLIHQVVPLEVAAPEIYQLLDQAFDHLAEGTAPFQVMYGFEHALLQSMGHAPRLNRCASCNVAPAGTTREVAISYPRGGVLCGRCATGQTDRVERIPVEILEVLQLLASDGMQSRAAMRLQDPAIESYVSRVLGRFLLYHLNVTPRSRIIARRIVRFGRKIH